MVPVPFVPSYTVPSLATRRSWRNDRGNYESRTYWHRVIAWGKLAAFAGQTPKHRLHLLVAYTGAFTGDPSGLNVWQLPLPGLNGDLKENEFLGAKGSDTYNNHEPACGEIILRHCGAVALDEVGPATRKRSLLSEALQVVPNRIHNLPPQVRIVGLKHGPLQALMHPLRDADGQTAAIDILPLGILGGRARAP